LPGATGAELLVGVADDRATVDALPVSTVLGASAPDAAPAPNSDAHATAASAAVNRDSLLTSDSFREL
jgi:hypothetical protein